MDKPVLVVMAAGMGSRFGGLKQMEPMDDQGHIIMDFSLYDARKAGFEKVIFIIKKEIEEAFREVIGNRLEQHMEVAYAFQEVTDIPDGLKVPEGRTKPWGTAHAVLSCRDLIDGPFAVINADDYYGAHAFSQIYDYLSTHEDNDKYRYAMVGYVLENTLTENGHVARGICKTDAQGYLTDIQERTRIERRGEQAAYTEDDGAAWIVIPEHSTVSMNLWGFGKSFLTEAKNGLAEFLEKGLRENPLKCEYFLPFVVDRLIREGKATVQVLQSPDRWYGVTYREDKETVVKAIKEMKEAGLYPQKLWEE